jgi:HSP20 family molecular chaperone IbpA
MFLPYTGDFMTKEKRKLDFSNYLRKTEQIAERMLASGWNETCSTIEPLSEIILGASEVVVTMDLPYVDPNAVQVSVKADDVIDVQAKTKHKISMHDLGVKHRKSEFSLYHTVLHMPVPVNEEGITYKMKRGILEIRLPRQT